MALINVRVIFYEIKDISMSDDVKIISPEEAIARVNEGKALIVDVREYDEYEESHIENTISLPLSSFAEDIEDIIDEIDPNLDIIMQCAKGGRSHQTCLYMMSNYPERKVFNMTGGIESWIEEDLPVIS